MKLETEIVLLLITSLLSLSAIYVTFEDHCDISFGGKVLAMHDLEEGGCLLYLRTGESIEKIFIPPNLLDDVESLDLGCGIIVDGSIVNFRGEREVLAINISQV
ncbi:MAG: hypothetical protein EF807_03790 [Candidatus Methanolliviera hydrocarbonicum]|uniref:Uncharacterized protein n=1 Tax=Candidatus Methanolliviera hydrocarbonicum TaxID=2491085 RepID=A0A520KX05_9EURY|nr:MAG: hypothetical protein EF807_03790 [Candidatus Methanolliviera hydrocarbonicum]